MSHEQGKYIVIEGNDGTGKSVQVEKIRERLGDVGIESIEFHEPAGTPIADEIRTIIKNGELERDGKTNLLLFTAARHEIWQRAERALALGRWVVSARNYYSTMAYQGYGEGLDLQLIENITHDFTSLRYMTPDLAVILTTGSETRSERIAARGEIEKPDTFESRGSTFQQALDDGYTQIAWSHRIPIIDASKPIEQVTDEIWKRVEPLIDADDARK